MKYQLAQVNIGRLRAPVDAPEIAEFVANLDPINALADRSPGFVWRLQTEDENATAVRIDDGDPLLAINMSVWESIDALAAFVFRSDHTAVMRRRREWFDRLSEAYLVLWWVPAGHRPTIDEAMERLQHLRDAGPSAEAFTFRQPFPPPGSSERIESDADWYCRA